MSEVSIYESIFGAVDGEVEDLGGEADEDKLNSMSLKFESRVSNLEDMCYIMEKVLLKEPSDAVVYAGFQKVSRARAIWDRYLDIADNVEQIYLFGEKDDDLPGHENIEFVYLPEKHPLVREWFLVIDKNIGSNMMVAYDQDGFGVEDLKEDRNFRGAKTSHPDHIDEASDLLDEVIEDLA
ncbi:DICT sensory domain-containing protein [Halarsenatibacter silvermanii]|uniref:Diguanylate Cyclase and Two-component system sensory domain-containing protein n=1 Tax=Halarsenatibacter silvermanii TaxID=321763 RepID=A0A1G9SJI8_9FIRM|nr:DICT sensory domain-containing protein [Halarsenatibacter silvermanii]SDM35656.1 Diguanylate Cyclase and Two-component system sensory domain-containing protein [Halarsenatibacter silvermanii]